MSSGPGIVVDLHAVIAAVTREVPRILTVRRSPRSLGVPDPLGTANPVEALVSGPLDPAGDRTLELQLRTWVAQQTSLDLGYVEQLYTFGDRNRGTLEAPGSTRVISIAYLALVREASVSGTAGARWQDGYRFLPWEDWRGGRPSLLDRSIVPALEAWIDASPDATSRRLRRDRSSIAFGLGGTYWDEERVLERYELLYESGCVAEALRDRGEPHGGSSGPPLPGEPLALDHRRILATALGRLRGKLKYRPLVFELLPPTFTLLQLQRVVEALSGVRLHKQNFRRLVERGGLVEGTGKLDTRTGGRPAELFRFRREVLRERLAPGVGLPGARPGGASQG